MKVLFTLLVSFFATISYAEIAVIVHPSNSNKIPSDYVKDIFLSKIRIYPDGSEAVPISLPEVSNEYQKFCKDILKKSSKQTKAYFSKLVFSGKGTPPREVDSGNKVVKLVSENPNLIGFIESSQVDSSVKVILIK